MFSLSSCSPAARRGLVSRAILFAAASSSTPPLGQDLSELFALYHPPKFRDAPLGKDASPQPMDRLKPRGHITGNDAVIETAVRELEEELGISLPAETLEASWLCTLPSSMTGETKHGKFVCNEFQEVFLVEGAISGSDVESLSLGADEVAGVELVDAADVLAAWDGGDSAYVPRGAPYRRVLGAALGFFPSGGW